MLSPTNAELAEDQVVGAAGGVPIGMTTMSVGSDSPTLFTALTLKK